MTVCCSCDLFEHPPKPNIPPGLTDLPRQAVGFPEYRRAMLAAIRKHHALGAWRARGAGDLGVMLLEMWAYVLDVTGFYDAQIADASYLPTVDELAAARRLAALIGYLPRPPIAARSVLAVLADGTEPVTLPRATAFRSEAFADEPPQIFETLAPFTIHPQHNRWELAPIRDAAFDGTLLLRPGDGAPTRGAAVALLVGGEPVHAGYVTAVATWQGPDQERYLRVTLDQPPSALTGADLADVELRLLGLTAALSPFDDGVSNPDTGSIFTLDALYPQIQANAPVAVETDGMLRAAAVECATRRDVDFAAAAAAEPVKIPQTEVTLDRDLDIDPEEPFRLHFHAIRLGRPTRAALTEMTFDHLRGSRPLLAPVALADTGSPGRFIARGARERGALMTGSVAVSGDGGGTFSPTDSDASFPAALSAPVAIHGNVIDVVRGESVFDEILGSADAATAFQSFTLKKAPLTWIEEPGAPNGRRPLLDVRVDGILWRRVETLYRAGPDDRVFLVREDADGKTRIVFGDGNRGARPSSGVDNVRADYRFGAGAAKPPPGAVRQPARPVKGLARALSPVPFESGGDAADPSEIRSAAPRSALTLGRVVSNQDFEAVARAAAGVLNAAVGWGWDTRRQRALVKVWIVVDQGDPSDDLATSLKAQAAPGTEVVVTLATAKVRALTADIDVDPSWPDAETKAAAHAALFDAKDGLLSPARVPIGGVIFRSVITERLHAVPGIAAVRALRIEGAAMGWAISPGEGCYFDFSAAIVE